MLRIPYHRYRNYLSRRVSEDTFSTLVLYAIFLSLLFLLFAFRGLIVSFFIPEVGVTPSVNEEEKGGNRQEEVKEGGL